MRYLFYILLLLVSSCVFAQPAYKHQLSITSENDSYLLAIKDGYYTNGIFINYAFTKEKNNKKIVSSFELGQMIFTPSNVNFYKETGGGIDRPFCGYLFLTYNQTAFWQKERSFQWAATIGTVGPNSLGQNMQETIHQVLRYKKFMGWNTQVKNQLGFNTKFQYSQSFNPFKTGIIKIIPLVEANLGTLFINAKAGGFICLGLMEESSHSALFDAAVTNKSFSKKHKAELFCYWHPQVIAQGYNATVQGGLLGNEEEVITASPQAFIYMQSFGIIYTQNRFTTKLEVTYQTQEANTQRLPQRYASIGIGYRFN